LALGNLREKSVSGLYPFRTTVSFQFLIRARDVTLPVVPVRVPQSQIVRLSRSIAETELKLHPTLLRLSAMISPFTCT
jgi:hypothetical protein